MLEGGQGSGTRRRRGNDVLADQGPRGATAAPDLEALLAGAAGEDVPRHDFAGALKDQVAVDEADPRRAVGGAAVDKLVADVQRVDHGGL